LLAAWKPIVFETACPVIAFRMSLNGPTIPLKVTARTRT
jgi:hypothetical protein